MKKIISLFKRDFEGNRQVIDEVTEGAEWVQELEGVATRKYDGTCCLIRDGVLYKRYTLRKGKKAPFDFIPATTVDTITGKQEGWVAVKDNKEDQYHREAFSLMLETQKVDGTYELVGVKVQGNPEGVSGNHVLVPHSDAQEFTDCPRDFDGLKEWLADKDIEGIVWHHSDGRMVKIKKSDFGMKRN